MTQEESVHVCHTSCKSCVFAVYEDRTQTDCLLGRTRRYQAQGCLLECEDHEAQFYVVNGRQCHARRTAEWGAKRDRSRWALEVREELRVRLDVIILLTQDVTLEKLEVTLDSLKAQTLPPSKVLLVSNQDSIPLGKLHARLSSLGLPWAISDILDRESDGSRVSGEAMVDLVTGRLEGMFYAVFHPGFRVPSSFVSDLDTALNDRLERFSVLLPLADGNGLVVQTTFHKHALIGGNEPAYASKFEEGPTVLEELPSTRVLRNLTQKAMYLASTQNTPHMVVPVTTICPALGENG